MKRRTLAPISSTISKRFGLTEVVEASPVVGSALIERMTSSFDGFGWPPGSGSPVWSAWVPVLASVSAAGCLRHRKQRRRRPRRSHQRHRHHQWHRHRSRFRHCHRHRRHPGHSLLLRRLRHRPGFGRHRFAVPEHRCQLRHHRLRIHRCQRHRSEFPAVAVCPFPFPPVEPASSTLAVALPPAKPSAFTEPP